VKQARIIVIGAGMGGLAAALDLAGRGFAVTVVERQATPGGKMRQVAVEGSGIDAGPTVFTMRWIFEELFAAAGARLEEHLALTPATLLARHAWTEGGTLDLFADVERSAEAIAAFAGAREAEGYRAFCARGAEMFRTLKGPFIASQRPGPVTLTRRVGFTHLGDLWRTAPHLTLWKALAQHFRDPRLRQLFGRYATYCGSSPLAAPATLMLVAHVEQDGVWLVKGGMIAVAQALQRLGEARGAHYRFNAPVAEIIVERGRAAGVLLASGERLPADAVVFNGDASALGAGLLGSAARRATAETPRKARSLSAVTWCVKARTAGLPLAHHTVFFARDYPKEFEAIFRDRGICAEPTVYVCAQDRDAGAHPAAPHGPERLLLLVNAPPDGDLGPMDDGALAALRERSFALLARCGLQIEPTGEGVTTTPHGFDALFPATGGALYGRASHGPMATFQRAGAASRVPGLYLAGGSVHPGPGIPMAAMSGRLAAARLAADLASG
jgi:1-hydroxycarotenoid 3,4-desaturase